MTWEYALIGLVVGIVIGAVAMRFGNRKLRQQQVLQNELDKSKTELEEYRQELVGHFARSAELLDNMARDYRQLYQHMAKSSNNLLPDLPMQENPFRYRLTEAEATTIKRRWKCRATIRKAPPACCAGKARAATDLRPRGHPRASSVTVLTFPRITFTELCTQIHGLTLHYDKVIALSSNFHRQVLREL